MLPNIFVYIESLLYFHAAAYSDLGGSGKHPADHLGNVSMVPHSVRLCCRRKGYSLYLHQKLVVSCIECGGWWSGGVTINTRALIMFSVTTATRITHDSNLSMFGGDFLPTLGESPPASGSSTYINTICSSQHKMIIMTCRGPQYLDFLHYHGVRGTENELYYV